jgi:hypothetical protein
MWSKDRAAQLDLTLQTFKKYFTEWKDQSVTIIYKCSNDFYKSGYDKVMQYHPEFKYVPETDFRTNTLAAINESKKEYVSFLVDDDIFIDTFSTKSPEFLEFDSNPMIACISPRLAPYVSYCYTQNLPAKKPVFLENRTWRWNSDCSGDWNYPWSVAALHVFRKNDLTPLNNIPFRAPNTFEAALCNVQFSGRNLMICFEHAKIFTASNNRVQNENNNRTEHTDPIDQMNDKFLNNKRLCPDENHYMIANACHGPVQYTWR